MNTTERSIQQQADKHRNELGYDIPFRVVRVLGWTDQYEDDYYWVVYERDVGLFSCVGGFVWLKDRLTKEEYERSDEVYWMNTPSLEEIFQEIKDKGIILK
jgi:hypothetical protein